MTDKIDLLPLPEDYDDTEGLWEKCYGPYSLEQMEDYARANVARAVEPLQSEIDALRTRLEDTIRDSTNTIEALREEQEVIVAEAKKYAGESGRLKARVELLAEALRLAEEHIDFITPKWYSAGQRVLAAIRAALRDHDQENDDA